MHQIKWFERKINLTIAVLILSMISIHCGSSSTAIRVYEGYYNGKYNVDKAIVVGRVLDKVSNDPLIGAYIILEESEFGGATDLLGNYVILNISPGTYNICAKYIGYKTAVLDDVKLDKNNIYIIDFRLVAEDYLILYD
ncbi:MAG: carboxypeptidase-like regulatory domain-containing protein [Ignavibacteriales bacterium]|nr:MAG: carboxypeptidase-like regulatory domain-containing protein [Ignavibacteriales bacterium]